MKASKGFPIFGPNIKQNIKAVRLSETGVLMFLYTQWPHTFCYIYKVTPVLRYMPHMGISVRLIVNFLIGKISTKAKGKNLKKNRT